MEQVLVVWFVSLHLSCHKCKQLVWMNLITTSMHSSHKEMSRRVQRHGHHNVCYTKYMCSKCEPRVMGNLEVYLNLDVFRRDNHTTKVKQLFEETVPGYSHAPTPRPTRAHTFDFNCTYNGAHILDGEYKASTTKGEIGFMVLHSTQQLVTQDMAMSMLTTSHQMAFYKMMKMRFRPFEDNSV